MPEEPWQEVVEVRSRQQPGAPELDNPGRLAVIGDPLVLDGVPGEHNPAALVAAVEETRVRKTPYEIECLAHANRIALAGHNAARDAFLEIGRASCRERVELWRGGVAWKRKET